MPFFFIVLPLVLVVYHLAIFPLLLLAIAARREQPAWKRSAPLPDEELPRVALMIAAHNEEKVIDEKLENSFQLDYPREKLTVYVLANGCSDATAERAAAWAEEGVVVLEEGPIGKAIAQNLAVEAADEEIIVFSDANTLYKPDALRHLVKPFEDDSVGAASGRHFYYRGDRATDVAEGFYWNKVEDALKRAESAGGGLLGANGSIYAVRRDRYIPLPSGTISDIFGPLLIAAEGFRTVYVPDAVSMEEAEADFESEYIRKSRIVRRTLHGLLQFPHLLDPRRHARIAWLLWSHKILRWLTPALLATATLGATVRMLGGRGRRLDAILFAGGSIFGFLATLGRGLGAERPIPVLTHAYYLFLMFVGAIKGIYEGIVKGGEVTWEHRR